MIALAVLQQDSLEQIREEVAVAVRQDWEVVLLVVSVAVLIRLALAVPRRLANTYLLQHAIFNLSRRGERRVSFALVIAYETSIEALARVGDVMREIVGTIPTARFDRAHLKTFSPWGYECEIVYWILSPDYVVYMDARERINLDLLRRLEAEGIRLGTPAAAGLAAAALAGAAEPDPLLARGR